MSYNIYPAKKLVKMAGHTFACNSVTSFLKGGGSNHRTPKCCKLILEKNREITTHKPEYEK